MVDERFTIQYETQIKRKIYETRTPKYFSSDENACLAHRALLRGKGYAQMPVPKQAHNGGSLGMVLNPK